MTWPFGFSWEVSSPSLLQEQEADLQLYLTHMRDKTADYFILKVRVRHQTCWTTHPQQPQSHYPPVLGAIDTFACHSSILMQAQEFLQNGSSHMQLHFPDDVIPNVLIHHMMPDVISYAEDTIQTRPSGFLYERPDFRLFSLNLDIIIQNSFVFVDDYDDIITDFIIEESMGNTNIKMVPTSKSAIDSLEEVKLEKNNNATERCSICLSEFDYGDDAEQVLSMPCKHVYHQECIIHWLKTSHLCPLCRYPMATN